MDGTSFRTSPFGFKLDNWCSALNNDPTNHCYSSLMKMSFEGLH